MPSYCFPVFLCHGSNRLHSAWIHPPRPTQGHLLLEVISLRALGARVYPAVPGAERAGEYLNIPYGIL